MNVANNNVLVVQLTGRMHFGAATALHSEGLLGGLLTDFHIPDKLISLTKLHRSLPRYVIPLPKAKVMGNPFVGLRYRYELRRHNNYSAHPHIIASRSLARQAGVALGVVEADTVFSFDIQALETFRLASKRGISCVLEQCVAPRKSQIEMLNNISSTISNKDLQHRVENAEILAQREEEEWQLADRIVCPSNYVATELGRFGVDDSKISVVPYGFDAQATIAREQRPGEVGSLKGIFVGSLDARKGIHDLVRAAEMLGPTVEFDVYGPIYTDQTKLNTQKGVIRYHGKVAFSEIEEAYKRADFFVLPSYLEGSATVVYEALSYGLPCLVTPQVGSVVTHMQEGMIIRPGDPASIVDSIRFLMSNLEEIDRMSKNAFTTAQEYTVARYGARLCQVFS